MKIPPVIHGLAAKRDRLIAEMEYHQARADKARKDIATVEAALALWEEGKFVRSVRRSYRENPGPFKWRELPRIVLDMLQASPQPLTTSALQAHIAEMKGLTLDTPAERKAFSRRVTGALNDKRRQGVIRSIGKTFGQHQWAIVPMDERVPDARLTEMYAEMRARRAARRLCR
jgi:hypothetical protein